MNYHEYRKSAGVRLGSIPWAANWEIVLTHQRPDDCTGGEYSRAYFHGRHVRPDVGFNWKSEITRDSVGMDEDPRGCHVSGASVPPGTGGDPSEDGFAHLWSAEDMKEGQRYNPEDGKTAHQRDWDILAEAVDQAYAKVGVTRDSSALDRIQALVELHNEHRGKVYPSCHPVDTLLYSSFCVGAANLFAALCMVGGFPVRTLNNAIHSMAEVWDGNRWLFVDNLTSEQLTGLAAKPGRNAESLLLHNYLETMAGKAMCADGSPLNLDHAKRYTESQPYFEPFINAGTKDWRFNHGRMGVSPKISPKQAGVGLFALPCPDNIRAIYPEWDEPLLFAKSGYECELSLTPRQGWLETVVRVDRQMGLCKHFYVGELGDGSNPVTAVRADLHLSDSIGSEFNPLRGGWILILNGQALSLDRDRFVHRTGLLSFELPVEHLVENSMNKVELYSEKTYSGQLRYRMPDALAVRAYPDVLGTELPWYGSDEAALYLNPRGPAEGATSVYDMHSSHIFSGAKLLQ